MNILTMQTKSPNIMLHIGGGEAGVRHAIFWIPFFIQSKINFCILTRESNTYNKLKKEFSDKIIFNAVSPQDVEKVTNRLPFLKVIFYTLNMGQNIHLLRFNQFKHIFLGSKDSEILSKITKFYRAYDEVYLSSESQIDKFKSSKINFGHLIFRKIGKPYLKNIMELKSITNNKIKILYLPSIINFSLLSLTTELFYKFDNLNINYLSMVLSNKNKNNFFLNINKNINNSSYNWIRYKDTINELDFISHDIIICDINTLSLECLASNVPIFLYVPKEEDVSCCFKDKSLFYNYAYLFSTIDELMEKINFILNGKDSLKEIREESIEYWIGREETLNDKFIEYLKQYV